jgi:predicted MPP superfamily phosphohydrolase
MRNLSRRKFFGFLGVSGLGAALDTRWLEPKWLGIGQHTVPLGKGRNGGPLKVLQLSDFHASKVVSLDFIEEALRLGLGLKPDLVLLTGDFITRKFDQFERYAEILSVLAKAAPCYACLGNHDGGLWSRSREGYADNDLVRNLLSKSGVELLHNRATKLRVKDLDFHLVGLGDWWAEEFDPGTAFASAAPSHDETVIVMSHNPDTKDLLKSYPWDLMVCGHTHGGQFYLPLIGTPFAPVNDKRFVKGLHRWNDRWIHITKGVGNLLGVRFNCRPEVSLLTLV